MRFRGLLLLRLSLHVCVALLLTIHSSQLGSSLHYLQRAAANEWVRLLFYVDVVKKIAPDETMVETLPHFLLEVEEMIAANANDEFFAGGFAARASALPVGLLFTINETRQHLHGVVRNYIRLADVALDSFLVYSNNTRSQLPPPLLTVRSSVNDDTSESLFSITNESVSSQWPPALRLGSEAARQQETRHFFDTLDAMEMKMVVGMRQKAKEKEKAGKTEMLYEWTVVMRYDLLNQGHLEVTMNYALSYVPLLDRQRTIGERRMPPVLSDTGVVFDWLTLTTIGLHQVLDFYLVWNEMKHAKPSYRVGKGTIMLALRNELRCNFWFWLVLALNLATVACLLTTWRHAYELSLNDMLCFTYAICCALQWLCLIRYLQENARFQILGLTLKRGLPRVIQFLVGVFPIFVGFVLFGTVMFGSRVPRFQSASTTATTLFSVANGDEIHDTFNDVAYTPWIGQIYVYSYMILFSYVVLMVCIGLIEDAFFSAVFPDIWPTHAVPSTNRD
ncbi:uncharacterized protein CCR75_003387 [Bremia lactucae]|uniref:Polycystin cation channel PKD1/PKD2 domain-containing protein n=1 Tax=Bremia lactucae TaxID=4779 RepID=A0A976FI02_BRELC|nr:hypothetical protein CCR75_007141 [Bremia lactucae]TDH67102.1 hypothetical protein CCR75_003387 [Bremia lactucae]